MAVLSNKSVPACLIGLLLCLAGCGGDPLAIRQKCVTNGNELFNQGKYRDASILYRRALQLDPKYADAWYRLGLVSLKLGDLRGAAAAFQRTHTLDPNNDDASIRLADIYVHSSLIGLDDHARQRKIATLQPLIEHLRSKYPVSYDTLRLSGYLELTQRDVESALQDFQAANEVKPWQPEIVLLLAENLAAKGNTTQAAEMGEQLLERHPDAAPMYAFLYSLYLRTHQLNQAETVLKNCVHNLPDEGRMRVQLALHYYATGQRQNMLDVLQAMRNDRKRLPMADLLIGDIYLRTGDIPSAVQAFRDGEKFNPKEKSAYEQRAIEALLDEGKIRDALDATEKLYDSDRSDVGVAAFRALLLARTDPRHLDKSIAELEALAAKHADNAVVHYYLGRSYAVKGDAKSLGKARDNLETSVSIRPEYTPAKMALAEVELQLGDGHAAAETSAEILRRDPVDLQSRLVHAMAMRIIGEPKKAREDLQIALALHRNSREAHLRLASLDLFDKHYQDADKGFKQVLAAGDPRGAIGVAETDLAQGHLDEAIKELTAQCARFPGSFECFSTLAIMEVHAGRYADAKTEFQHLIAMRPAIPELYARLAETQAKTGDRAGALVSFQNARRLDPTNINAALGIAVMLDAAGKTNEATAAYEEVLRMDATNTQALNNLAYIKADQGVDLDRAIALAQGAVQRAPSNAGYGDTLGYVYYKHGLLRESRAILEPLAKNNPKNPAFHIHLAMTLYALGRKDLARPELKLAMSNRPTPPEQVEIEALAAKLTPATERVQETLQRTH